MPAKRTLREERHQGELVGQVLATARKAGQDANLHTILPGSVRRTAEYKKLSDKRRMFVDGYCLGVADGKKLASAAAATTLASGDSGVHAISTNPPPASPAPAERPSARRGAPAPVVQAPTGLPYTTEELEQVGAALLQLMRAKRTG